MSITEFAVHNVLRTYSRQDRLGRLQRQKGSTQAPLTGDKVNLSPTAQKINLMGQVANEIVDRKSPETDAERRQALVRNETERLMEEHRSEIENRLESPEQFGERLTGLYLK